MSVIGTSATSQDRRSSPLSVQERSYGGHHGNDRVTHLCHSMSNLAALHSTAAFSRNGVVMRRRPEEGSP